MPSKSAKQAEFMKIAAASPEFAKKAGIPQSVAREYREADKRKPGFASPRKHGKATSR
jgi:hypothetical protein